MSKIAIAADIVPTPSNIELFTEGDTARLIGDSLIERLRRASFIVMNLETPLSDEACPIRKAGPCLIAPTKAISGLKAINPFFFTLANNHILDQGDKGLYSTMNILGENHIGFAGAGKSLEEARKPYVVEIGGRKLGIYCCAEHEFSIAANKKAGANPYDPLESFDDIKQLKEMCDYAIVLYHGGKELYRYPSPHLQKVFRKFADSGADIVVAQHTHCIGCKEDYKESTLVYGQGNFLFDHSKKKQWETSLIIELDLNTGIVDYVPLVKAGNGVREAKGARGEQILMEFMRRSEEIKNEEFVREHYTRYAQEIGNEYLMRFSGRIRRNLLVRFLGKLTSYRFIRHMYQEESRLSIKNILDCEAHRELASEVMAIHK
ncbi:MAG: CapA family protein [Lachnospiraceae bacterium]|nr:CapA family protein [Lachnospiraceae bacterium]